MTTLTLVERALAASVRAHEEYEQETRRKLGERIKAILGEDLPDDAEVYMGRVRLDANIWVGAFFADDPYGRVEDPGAQWHCTDCGRDDLFKCWDHERGTTGQFRVIGMASLGHFIKQSRNYHRCKDTNDV
jgi:hypothetical protein